MDQPTRPGFFVTTVIGGLLFLLPILLLLYLLELGIDMVEGPAGHLAALLPVFNRLGPFGDLLVAILLLVIIAFVAGLLLMSSPGQSLGRCLRDSPLTALPIFSFVRGLSASFGADGEKVSVVLVPSDQGQTLAFVFGPVEGETICVYVPSAPRWTSGSISFARREDVQETSLTFSEATRIIMMLGSAKALTTIKSKALPLGQTVANVQGAAMPAESSTRPNPSTST